METLFWHNNVPIINIQLYVEYTVECVPACGLRDLTKLIRFFPPATADEKDTQHSRMKFKIAPQ